MQHSILIIGAGPVGLTHAIELRRLGHSVRIIDQNLEPSPYSKAIVVNPKTLSYLADCGASDKLIAEGVKLTTMNIHNARGERLVQMEISQLPHRYPFMLAVPQYVTERILTEVLSGYGVQIERGKTLSSFSQNAEQVLASISSSNGNETIAADYLVGADGAHSIVRKTLGLEFAGFAYDDQWNLVDVTMVWPEALGDGNVYLLASGIVLLVLRIAPQRYRVITNHPNALNYLPAGAFVQQVHWQSDFKVSCRQVAEYQKGRVFLMGDAAHIHSPAGGRGMNLGIEDACVLAQLFEKNQTDSYTKLRHPVGKKVIHMTHQLFSMATLKSSWRCVIRNWILRHIVTRPKLQAKVLKSIAGLD
jgi:2-polyprenyl-6-methoxyphenol hydroxylase-like FAD-dependent oxidoreductase